VLLKGMPSDFVRRFFAYYTIEQEKFFLLDYFSDISKLMLVF
jgi:hypothetical protein